MGREGIKVLMRLRLRKRRRREARILETLRELNQQSALRLGLGPPVRRPNEAEILDMAREFADERLPFGFISWLSDWRLRGSHWRTLPWMQYTTPLTFRARSKGEAWATGLGWFIPRKYRDDIVGDILEDCVEMREAGRTERRIKFHVVYQWLIAVITLVPTAVKTSIVDAVKQVISRPK